LFLYKSFLKIPRLFCYDKNSLYFFLLPKVSFSKSKNYNNNNKSKKKGQNRLIVCKAFNILTCFLEIARVGLSFCPTKRGKNLTVDSFFGRKCKCNFCVKCFFFVSFCTIKKGENLCVLFCIRYFLYKRSYLCRICNFEKTSKIILKKYFRKIEYYS